MGELRGTVVYRNNRIIVMLQVSAHMMDIFVFWGFVSSMNVPIMQDQVCRRRDEISISKDSRGTEVNFCDSCSIQGLQSTLRHMQIWSASSYLKYLQTSTFTLFLTPLNFLHYKWLRKCIKWKNNFTIIRYMHDSFKVD